MCCATRPPMPQKPRCSWTAEAKHWSVYPNRTWTFDILVTARSDSGQSAGYSIRGVIENVGGNTAIVGTLSEEVLGEDDTTWGVTVEADNATNSLVINVTGAAGVNVRWVATVRTAEVSW